MLTIHNTLTAKKEIFEPQKPPQITMYVCGITPYDNAHVGHGRCYVTFDVIYRLLTFIGYKVTYCRNFTDIDDKIINRAIKELGDQNRFLEIANKYIASFTKDMQDLNCIRPTIEPRVTTTIPEIITFVQGLINAGKAYVVDGDVYFDISQFPDYGALSKHKLEDLQAGARVEINTQKKNPLDFALWKSEPEGHFYKSPWGWGRPGWHIECSAMADKYLGPTIDLHGGGMDLIFPHHENELAQSQALHNAPLARYWVHNGFVQVNKIKMSKSLGNFFTLRDLFAQFDPIIVRFYFLNHHYRAPLDFSLDDLHALTKTYQRLCRALQEANPATLSNAQILNSPSVQELLAILEDDLNTPGMFGLLFEKLPALQQDKKELTAVKQFLIQVLGLPMQSLATEQKITPEIEKLLQEREVARTQKNWARSDQLRDQLKKLGYEVQDKKLT